MQNCMNTIQRLDRLCTMRPSPEDTLINIAEAVRDSDMDEEAWANFYTYITTENRGEWQYRPKSEIKTLGDLSPEQLQEIDRTLCKQLEKHDKDVEVIQNGIETMVFVCKKNKYNI